MSEHEVTQLTTRIAYENRWLRVREDTVRRADGSQGLFGVVERRAFVVLVPWQDGCITMVEQYRYPVRRRLWELPMGTCEPGAAPLETAATELREETGLLADRLERIATVFQGAGYSAWPLAAVEAMIGDGTLQDAISLAALGVLRFRGLL